MSAKRLPRFERAVRCVLALQRGERVTVQWMVATLGVSRAQAKRDMLELERVLPVERQGRPGMPAFLVAATA